MASVGAGCLELPESGHTPLVEQPGARSKMYSVIFYCPDRHIVYDGRTPVERGVGGGITQRVRMARALAQMGHHVTAVVNCPRREVIDGVQYVPLGATAELRADVPIANTSGGASDLSD